MSDPYWLESLTETEFETLCKSITDNVKEFTEKNEYVISHEEYVLIQNSKRLPILKRNKWHIVYDDDHKLLHTIKNSKQEIK